MSWQCNRQRTDNVSKCKLVSHWSSPPQCSSLIGRGMAAAAARLLVEQRPRGLGGLSSGRERAVALLEWGGEWSGESGEGVEGGCRRAHTVSPSSFLAPFKALLGAFFGKYL